MPTATARKSQEHIRRPVCRRRRQWRRRRRTRVCVEEDTERAAIAAPTHRATERGSHFKPIHQSATPLVFSERVISIYQRKKRGTRIASVQVLFINFECEHQISTHIDKSMYFFAPCRDPHDGFAFGKPQSRLLVRHVRDMRRSCHFHKRLGC